MNRITITTVVYNEELRIENFIKNCLWSDDIVIYDKSSTDKTLEIASKYPCRVITVPYWNTGAGATKNIISDAKHDWIFTLSCSDIIHPMLVKKITELVNLSHFDYDIIAVPYQNGVFGIIDKRSPWDISFKKYLYRKSAVLFTEKVHNETSFISNKVFYMCPNKKEALFHLTHENLSTFLERHIRYTEAEANLFKSRKEALSISFKEVIVVLFRMLFVKKTWLLGWDGIGLMFALLTYYMMKYLFAWQRFDAKGTEVYKIMREEILNEWDKYHDATK